jgi:hypothetical protein
MKHPEHFDPQARMAPRNWSGQGSSGERVQRSGETHKWLTTLPAPLAQVRLCTLEALAEMHADLAYRYETAEKIVIRCTLPERQIRAELKPLDAGSTRIVVVTMHGADVDRLTSGRVVDAVEQKLEDAGYPVDA